MENANSVIVQREYGNISFHFREIMDAKGMSRNELARLINARFEVADRLYAGEIERLDIDVLTRACFALDCQISDVIQYHKP